MAVKAYFNTQGCRNRDGFKFMNRMNRKKAAPMFQFAFPALLFQLRARGPQLRPLLQFPNRRQTPPGDAVPIPLCFVFIIYAASKLRYLLGECFAPPDPPKRLRRQVVKEDRRRRCASTHSRHCRTNHAPAGRSRGHGCNTRTVGRRP